MEQSQNSIARQNSEVATYDNQTFITGVKKGIKADTQFTPEINGYYSQLNDMVENLDKQVSEVIKYHEWDFFSAFKDWMLQIKMEMQELKEKAS